MKTLITAMTISSFLLINGCCSDSKKASDTGSPELSTPATSSPASNRNKY